MDAVLQSDSLLVAGAAVGLAATALLIIRDTATRAVGMRPTAVVAVGMRPAAVVEDASEVRQAA
jgi:hypothetical protein